MDALIPLATSLTSALVAATWQGVLLAVVVALCMRLVPSLTSAARSLVWLTVAALAVLLHFTQVEAKHIGTGTSSLSHALRLDSRWSLLVITLWAAASIVRASEFVIGALELRRLARAATSISAPGSCAALLAQSPRLESCAAELCVSADVDRPSLLGFFHPRVVLPAAVLETLTPAELQQVLLHELEHLRRRDDWINLFGRLALVVFPLNPVLLWLERRLAIERELACDDRVLEATGARKAYAMCLAQLAENTLVQRGVSLALGLAGVVSRPVRSWPARSELARRVNRILTLPTQPIHPRVGATLSTLFIVLAMGGSVELARSPQLIRFTSPTASAQFASLPPHREQVLPVFYHPEPTAVPAVFRTTILRAQRTSVHLAPATLKTVSVSSANRMHGHATARTSVMPSRPFLQLGGFLPVATAASEQLTFTVVPPNHFSYAAVPVRGGYILVLLPVQAAQSFFTLEL